MHDRSVSVSKGIGIILMVLAHSRFSLYGDSLIAMFHMPLFFFFSGYCFKVTYLDSFKRYAIRKVKGIYWPYIKWSMVFLILHNVFFYLGIYNGEFVHKGNVQRLYSISDIVTKAFYTATTMSGHEQLLGGYWFLHTLFLASFISYGVIWICNSKIRIPEGLGGAFLMLLCFVALFLELKIPIINLGGRELLAAFFIVIGYIYRSNDFKLEENLLLIVVIGCFLVPLGASYWQCSMLSLTWQKIIPYSISALAGTLMVFSISKMLLKKGKISEVMDFIGANTLTILTWHFLCFKLVSMIIIYLNDLSILRLADYPVISEYAYSGWWIAYLVVGVSLPCAFVLIGSMYKQCIKNQIILE